jgi:hypothetical protein
MATLLVGVEYGLFLGLLVQLIINTYRNQKPKIAILGKIENTEVYADVNSYNVNQLLICKIQVIQIDNELF